jgi:hypothetical protein
MRAALIALLCVGCGSRGSVSFVIRAPSYEPLNPIDERVTEFSVKRMDGTVVGVASQTAMSGTNLPLGVLAQTTAPLDLQVSVLSGSTLLGLARVKDVSIQPAVQRDYAADVRKPLITIGSTVPTLTGEMLPNNAPLAGQILDPSTFSDLAKLPGGPRLPTRTTAAASTWDGRFLLAAGMGGLSVIDTGSGQTVGLAALNFEAARVVVGARDSAVAVLDPNGAVMIYADVAALVSNPATAGAKRVDLAIAQRTAAFSPDGKTLYVLGGPPADPCSPTAGPQAPNSLSAVGIDGTMIGEWRFSGFVADMAIDAAGERFMLSDVAGDRVTALDIGAPFGQATTTKITDADCPSALRLAGNELFVVTNSRSMDFDPPAFEMLHVTLRSGAITKLYFSSPIYDRVDVPDMPTPGGTTSLGFRFTPVSLVAQDMALSPDGSRAVFTTRARYREINAPLTVFTNPCRANYEIVEYGVYDIDTRSGQSNYRPGAQVIGATTGGRATCITCTVTGGGTLPFTCLSNPGDRPAGLATVFGGT